MPKKANIWDAPDAAEIVAAVADAAGLLLRELHSLLTKRII